MLVGFELLVYPLEVLVETRDVAALEDVPQRTDLLGLRTAVASERLAARATRETVDATLPAMSTRRLTASDMS